MSRPRRLLAVAGAITACLVIGIGGWLTHSYLYDAEFMQVSAGSTTATVNICSTGQPLYFGYAVTPTHAVHLTAAELVGVPDSITVEGIYGVKMVDGNYVMLGTGNQDSWTKGGYA